MKRYFMRFFVALCMVSLVVCLLPKPGITAEIRLKYASFFPPTHAFALLSDQWCKELEKRTDGRVKVGFFPAGTLVTANQTYDGVVKGIVDIGLSIMSYTPGRMPLSEVIVLP